MMRKITTKTTLNMIILNVLGNLSYNYIQGEITVSN